MQAHIYRYEIMYKDPTYPCSGFSQQVTVTDLAKLCGESARTGSGGRGHFHPAEVFMVSSSNYTAALTPLLSRRPALICPSFFKSVI